MILAIVLVALVLIARVEAQVFCRSQSCTSVGNLCFASSACNLGNSGCTKQCPWGSTCKVTYPDGLSRCVNNLLFAPCTTNSDCTVSTATDGLGFPNYVGVSMQSLVCSTASLKCIPASGGRVPGDTCDNYDQCNAVSSFTLGRCDIGASNRCVGNGLNGPCASISDCNVGFYCNGTNCLQQGTSCNANDERQCADRSTVCIGSSCTFRNSVGVGLPCAGQQTACNEGLTCNLAQTCSDGSADSALVGVNCTAVANPSNLCGNTLSCGCNTNAGNAQCLLTSLQACAAQRKTYDTCLNTNQCHFSSNVNVQGSCAFQFCRSQFLSYINCFYSTNSNRLANQQTESCRFGAGSASVLESFLFE